MPNLDGTGSMGQGAMKGRGRGYCVGGVNNSAVRPGFGWGFGRGRRRGVEIVFEAVDF